MSHQRVLTPEEYAALGYIQRSDFDPAMFAGTGDAPLSSPMIDLAYRADTKEQAAMEIGYGVFKVGIAISTGGIAPALTTALGYTTSLIGY
tara:strand:- start:327 stop:599 length:273 start_codon:yes stop_codon:yes gene_type:complete